MIKKIGFIFPGEVTYLGIGGDEDFFKLCIGEEHVCIDDTATLDNQVYLQPVLGISAMHLWDAFRQNLTSAGIDLVNPAVGQTPQDSLSIIPFFGGLELGEIVALYAAESLSRDNALRMLTERGILSSRVQDDSMVTIYGREPLPLEMLENVCTQITKGSFVQAAVIGYINPYEVIVAGNSRGIDQVIATIGKTESVYTQKHPGKYPGYTLLMQEQADVFAAYIKDLDIQPPSYPYLVSGLPLPNTVFLDEPDKIRIYLAAQLANATYPYRTIGSMISRGVERFAFIGEVSGFPDAMLHMGYDVMPNQITVIDDVSDIGVFVNSLLQQNSSD